MSCGIQTTAPMRLWGPVARLPASSARLKRSRWEEHRVGAKRPLRPWRTDPGTMAACEEAPEALKDQLDVARGLENLPVGAWPPGAEPEPFQVWAGLGWPESRAAPEGVAGLVFGEAGLGGLERYVRSVGVGAGAFSRKRSSRVRGRLAGFPITVSGRLSMVDAHACFGFSKFFDLFFFFSLNPISQLSARGNRS